MRPYVLLFTVYGLSINRPPLALSPSLFPSLALSICVIFCCNATCEHCEQRVFLHCSFVNFMYFWCAIFNRMRKRRRKMLTLNLIGIWNDGRPCTRQIGRSRWSNRFTLLLLALTFLCFDFFNSLLNRYREQWTRWDSDFLDRLKFRSNFFLVCAVELYQSMRRWSTNESFGISNDLTQLIVGTFYFETEMHRAVWSGSNNDCNQRKQHTFDINTWNLFFVPFARHLFYRVYSIQI